MNKIFTLFILFFVAMTPLPSFAHGGGMMNFGELQTGSEMMKYVEEGVLGDELHEEMEQLMTKMMSGEMTQDEAGRITELMGQYPGPYGTMMVRLGSPQVNRLGWANPTGEDGFGWNMMSGWNGMMGPGQVGLGWGGLWFWIFTLSWFVWTAAGVLLIIWLAKKAFASK